MWIKKLYATFGSLENEILELRPGLNIVYGRNESGKSTRCAAIRAMFFGISTREKERAGHLPDKIRYRPRSGSPMYGRMELSKGGRDIIIERTSSPKTGVFSEERAIYAESGLPCATGEALVGVSKSVYERCAFISQSALGLDRDAETERRILSAASSGDENVSASEVIARLEKKRRELRSPRGKGILPELEAELAGIDAGGIPQHLLPLYDELRRLETDAARAESALAETRLEISDAEREAERQKAFDGMSDSLAETCAVRDIDRLAEAEKRRFSFAPLVFLILSALFCVLTVLTDKRFAVAAIISAFISLLLTAISVSVHHARRKKLKKELLARYGTDTSDGITDAYKSYVAAFGRLEKCEARLAELCAVCRRKSAALEKKKAEWDLSLAAEREKDKRKYAELSSRRKELELEYDALTLAAEKMARAEASLKSRFSPGLERRTAEIFEKLTGGSFKVVRIKNADFEMSVAAGEAAAPQDGLSLSRGTMDELWFSLRFALCDLLLGEEDSPPIILDDVFVNFDDERLSRALMLLSEIAERKQIILFSCHRREAEFFKGNPNINIIGL